MIGILGEIGAGKEEFFNFLNSLAPGHVVRYSTSSLLRQTLEEWGIEVSRDNLQDLAIQMDSTFGKGTLTNAIKNQLLRQSSNGIVVYDSIRWHSDVDLIKQFPHEIVYITADQKLRWQRSLSRNEKAGDNKLSFEEFQEKEKRGTETMIKELGVFSGHRFVNDGTLLEYHQEISVFFELYVKPHLRN